MREIQDLVKKIKLCCVLTIILVTIVLLINIVYGLDNPAYFIGGYHALVVLYIFVQIKKACNLLMRVPLFPPELTCYITKISYACFACGVGTTFLDTLITSISLNRFHLGLHLTMVGIGFLLYTGAYIYDYGCQMEEEYELTI
jgi:hypothetical protein